MIRATNLTKLYGGRPALSGVTFEISDGETVGFLGLNGAGKTTALRLLACDLRPSAGTIEVGGIDAIAEPHEVRKRIGFLPENPPLYLDMSVVDYLSYAGELRQMSRAEVKKRMPEVLELTDLADVAREVIGTLSHGYRQRVGVAQAIIHQPKFLILDEPTRGLDPVQIVEMRNLIHDLKQNHTVLISSHILTEISQTCDRLLVLGRGKMLAVGTEDELSGLKNEIHQITVMVRSVVRGNGKEAEAVDKDKDAKSEGESKASLKKLLAGIDGVTGVSDPHTHPDGISFELATTKDCRAAVSRAVVTADLDLLKLDYARSELENTFIRLVGGAGHASN
jgi:ABC-2 type transport system ATP-binding protein